ncbi:hypothetical protein KIW84_041854 [Lathyrus oleraceus]|uniref:EF-hand domain-containing protein n=1 Tax=Pisum sativum TaxID=3888 RepID=A0A9D4XB20_PEA|nr:hypothetical protein KIW84_041854 [Pisum sativum]
MFGRFEFWDVHFTMTMHHSFHNWLCYSNPTWGSWLDVTLGVAGFKPRVMSRGHGWTARGLFGHWFITGYSRIKMEHGRLWPRGMSNCCDLVCYNQNFQLGLKASLQIVGLLLAREHGWLLMLVVLAARLKSHVVVWSAHGMISIALYFVALILLEQGAVLMQIVGNVAGSVFLYLTDYSLQKRSREMAKRALEKKITLPDLAAADLDNDGSISKLDFVISKQLDSLDHGIYGKITLADLMETV